MASVFFSPAQQNNPLHVSIFPSYDVGAAGGFAPVRTPLQFSLLLSSTLDVFALRARHNTAHNVGLTGDYGLLHAVDERLAAYGFETNTSTKFVVIVDMRGRRIDGAVAAGLVDGSGGGGGGGGISGGASGRERRLGAAAMGLREGEMKPVSMLFFLLPSPLPRPSETYEWSGSPRLRAGAGVQGDADSVHQIAAESFLRPGRAFAAGRHRRQEDYEQEVRRRHEADRRELDARRDSAVIFLRPLVTNRSSSNDLH